MTRVFAAAPLDGQARLVLVAWLCGAFALVAGLMAWSLAGGGVPALAAAMVLGVAVPGLVLVRLAALPAAFEVDGDTLVVRRYLGGARAYRVRGPAVAEPRAVRLLRGRRVLLGGRHGCATVRDPGGGRPLHLAATDLGAVLRVPTSAGPLLVSPADPDALARALAALAAPRPPSARVEA